MKTIFTTAILSSFIAVPAFASDFSDIMSGNAYQLSNTEMQQTVGAGYFYNPGVSVAIAEGHNQVTNVATFYGKIRSYQDNNVHAGAVRHYGYGSGSYATAIGTNSAVNLAIGAKISNSQYNNVSAYSH